MRYPNNIAFSFYLSVFFLVEIAIGEEYLQTMPAALPPVPVPATIKPSPSTEAPPVVLPPEYLKRCPPGSIFMNGKCRKILCSRGEYYKGQCIQPACPEGTVWRKRQCQEPGYITTVIEIENVYMNEAHYKRGNVSTININNKRYHTQKPSTQKSTRIPTTKRRTTTTSSNITTTTTPQTHTPTKVNSDEKCCTIISPRTCKLYGKKWICFNRRFRRCDPNICKYPVIYLKIANVTYSAPILTMPPNPPLTACSTPDCDNKNAINCSGCAENRRDTCSPYCYNYNCPQKACTFIDMEEYCNNFPNDSICNKDNGCIWGWCNSR